MRYLYTLVLLSVTHVYAQNIDLGLLEKPAQRTRAGEFKKGEFFIYWGYNRAFYSKSDIHFSDGSSDFTIHNVRAKDRPTPFSFQDYFVDVTLPQFNGRAGFFFKDNWAIAVGTDHMKYVMVEDQIATISGTISDQTPESAPYSGTYNNDEIKLHTDFLRYEHTDGLNYISADLEHYHELWKAKNGIQKITFVPSFNLALLYPRSDVDIFDVDGENIFHVAGWGTSLSAGFRLNFTRNLFFTWNNKGGFIALPDVLCQLNNFKANQHFWFVQTAWHFGYSVHF